MKLQPYSWQEECLKKWAENGYRGIIDVVTGAGKTYLATLAIQTLQSRLPVPLYVFVVVPTCELQNQWIKTLRQIFPEEKKFGRISGGHYDSQELRFQIFVVNSARSCLSKRRNYILSKGMGVLLIADECHHYGARENRKIFENIPAETCYYTLGLSATPDSIYYKTILKPNLGPVIYRYHHAEAVKDKIIAPFSIQQIAVDFNLPEMSEYTSLSHEIAVQYSRLIKIHPELGSLTEIDFRKRIEELIAQGEAAAETYKNLTLRRKKLVLNAESRLDCTVDLIANIKTREKRIIVFCERIAQADSIYEMLENSYSNQVSKYHSGQDKEKNRAQLRLFRDGITNILITCKALDEGIDVPDADVAIILSGTSQQRQRIQRLGRILRKNGESKFSVLYYLYILQSNEDSNFIPVDELDIKQYNFRYYTEEKMFSCPIYEDAALKLLKQQKEQKTSEEKIKKIREIILKGMMTADWQKQEEYYKKQIESCDNIQGRNYWKVMKWIAATIEEKKT